MTRHAPPKLAEGGSSAPVRPSAWKGWVLVSGLGLAVFWGAFWPALSAGFLDWDDNLTVVDNPHITSLGMATVRWAFSTFFLGHYQPLSWLSLALDHALWGLDPFGFHLTNLILHLFNALLVFALLRFLLRLDLRPGGVDENLGSPPSAARALWIPALAAALWAEHPQRVESVVWVTERRDVLSTALLLGALLAYLPAARRAGGKRLALSSPALLGGTALFAASLLAKASGITFVPLLLVLDFLVLGRMRTLLDLRMWRDLVVEKIPLVALSGLAIAAAPMAQKATAALVPWALHPLSDRILVVFYGVAYYAARVGFPFGLSPLYELPTPLDPSQPLFAMALACTAVLSLLAVGLALRRAHRMLAFGLLFYLPLAPVLGLFQSGPQLVADRYSYLPSIVLAGGVALWLSHRVDRPGASAWPWLAAGGAALLLCAVLTFRYSTAWRNSESLWHHALESQPGCGYCREALGLAQLKRGATAEGVRNLQLALSERPNLMKANAALAQAYEGAGDLLRARSLYLHAYRLRPDIDLFSRKFAELSERLGEHDVAAQAWGELSARRPNQPQFASRWQLALAQSGRCFEVHRDDPRLDRATKDAIEAICPR